jgi:hypothetical protein
LVITLNVCIFCLPTKIKYRTADKWTRASVYVFITHNLYRIHYIQELVEYRLLENERKKKKKKKCVTYEHFFKKPVRDSGIFVPVVVCTCVVMAKDDRCKEIQIFCSPVRKRVNAYLKSWIRVWECVLVDTRW